VDKIPHDNVEKVCTDNALIKDMGSVSMITRGMILQYPWFENSAPPFDRTYCPTC
jgi:hypothetical protein